MSSRHPHPDFNLLRSLEVFLAIAEQGQLTRAAAALGITQSAVSQHLANLENHYGTELLDRGLRPLQLTLTGQALRQHARELQQRVQSIDGDLNQIGQPQIPLLRVALLPSLATLLTPVVIDTAQSLYQVSQISLFADLSSRHQPLLASRQVDLAITSQAFYDMDGLARHPILRERFLLLLPPGEADFDGDLERLARRLPMVRFSPSTPVGALVDQHLRRCDVAIERFLDADRTTMIMAAVAAGHGFSILSPTLLIDGIIEGMELSIQPLPLSPLQRDVMLIHRSNELDRLPAQLCAAVSQQLGNALERLESTARQAVEWSL